MTAFVRTVDRLSTVLAVIAAAMVVAAVLVVTWMVIIRTTGSSNWWETELSIYLSVGACFLASPYTLRTKGHVAVDFLGIILPRRLDRGRRFLFQIVGLCICLYLAVVGAEMAIDAWITGERTSSLWRPPVWPLYATLPVGMLLTALQYLVEIVAPDRPGTEGAAL